jgi:peptide/nickel transport system substrate-binding protein
MRQRLLVVMALLIAIVLPLSAGGNGEQQVIQPQQGEESLADRFDGLQEVDREVGWEKGTHGGTFVLSQFGSDPKTFNASVAAETSTTNVTGQLYASLFRRDQFDLEWQTWAAESYEISDDQSQITVTLRDGMQWSDGEAVTAEDWVQAVNEVYLNEAVQTNQRGNLIIGGEPTEWEQLGRLRLQVTFPEPYAGIFNTLAVTPLPMHIFGPLVEEEGGEAVNSFWGVNTDVSEVVGNGPFTIAEYRPGERVRLERNPNYFLEDEWGQELPYVDEVVYTYVADQDTQLQRFLAGELDFYSVRGEDYSVLVGRRQELDFTMYSVGPASSTQFITFNQNPAEGPDDNGITEPELNWLSNLRFRRAMAHLVDRETIIDNIAFGFGYPQYSFVWSQSPYYWEGAEDLAYKYDPQRARELLDSIDYVDRDGDGVREDPNGNDISLVLNTNSGNRVREAIGELFAQEASQVGIDVTFRPEDFNQLVTRLTSSYDWEMILIGLTGSVDPISSANVYPSSGNLHMIEPNQEEPRREWEQEVDEAWARANFTTDEEQRQAGYQELQRLWIENVPWVYTYNPAVMHAYTNDWGNRKPQPVDGYGAFRLLERIYQR